MIPCQPQFVKMVARTRSSVRPVCCPMRNQCLRRSRIGEHSHGSRKLDTLPNVKSGLAPLIACRSKRRGWPLHKGTNRPEGTRCSVSEGGLSQLIQGYTAGFACHSSYRVNRRLPCERREERLLDRLGVTGLVGLCLLSQPSFRACRAISLRFVTAYLTPTGVPGTQGEVWPR